MRHLMTPNATQQLRRHRVRLTDVLKTISRSEHHFMQDGRHIAERCTASGSLLRVVYLRRPYPVIITVVRVVNPSSPPDQDHSRSPCGGVTA